VLLCILQAYGRELSEAYEWISKFRISRKEAELHQARTRLHAHAYLCLHA